MRGRQVAWQGHLGLDSRSWCEWPRGVSLEDGDAVGMPSQEVPERGGTRRRRPQSGGQGPPTLSPESLGCDSDFRPDRLIYSPSDVFERGIPSKNAPLPRPLSRRGWRGRGTPTGTWRVGPSFTF